MPPSGKTIVYNIDNEPPAAKPKKDGPAPADRFGSQIKLKAEASGDQSVNLELSYRESQPVPKPTEAAGKKAGPGTQRAEFETKAELRKGQLLMLVGPVQIRMEVYNESVPVISEIPYIGATFRKVKEERNEIQLLVLVQPEIVPPHATAAGHRPADGDLRR